MGVSLVKLDFEGQGGRGGGLERMEVTRMVGAWGIWNVFFCLGGDGKEGVVSV